MTSNLGPGLPRHLRPNFEAMSDRGKSALDRLSASSSVEINLRDLQRTLALTARSEGATWEEIGSRVGLTKQGAHMRFGFGAEREGGDS